jgi:spore coat protein CotH
MVTIEQAVKNAVKEEIGDVEDMPFKKKNQLNQKFGAANAVLIEYELDYWEMREKAGNLSDDVWQEHIDYMGGRYAR